MRILILIMVCTLINGCGLFKRTNKHLVSSEQVVSVKRDSTKSVDIESKTIDKGTSTVEIETITERKRDGGRRVITGNLNSGRNVFLDSVFKEVVLNFDSLTRQVQIELNLPPIQEKVIKKERRQEQRDTEKTEVKKENVAVRNEDKHISKEKEELKESKPEYSWIVVVVGLFFLIKWIRKRHLI